MNKNSAITLRCIPFSVDKLGVRVKQSWCDKITSFTAQWRSGNAAVCKTATRGFDSRLRLLCLDKVLMESGKLKY